MKKHHCLVLRGFMALWLNAMAIAQIGPRDREPVPLKNWPVPLYWQSPVAEARANAEPDAAGLAGPTAQAAQRTLMFVGLTPCRMVDTRTGQGFTGAFAPPSLARQANRTLPIQSNPNCSILAAALAYSFNVTMVPPEFLAFVTVYPMGAPRPPPVQVVADHTERPHSGLCSQGAYTRRNENVAKPGLDASGSRCCRREWSRQRTGKE
jgi:hypothetical protein